MAGKGASEGKSGGSALEKRRPKAMEETLLRLLSEQVGIRFDQAGRFLGIGYDDVVALVEGMLEPRWVRREVLLEGEEPWLWLRRAGVGLAETGYGYKKPKLSTLERLYAVNEVRLAVMGETDGVWVCERELWRRLIEEGVNLGRRFAEGDVGIRVPDAVVEVEGRSYAIEVVLSLEEEDEWRGMMSEHHLNYAATKCFCDWDLRWEVEDIRRELNEERVKEGRGEVSVFIGDGPDLDDVGIQERTSDERGEAEEWEVPLLAVVNEHGALRVDQLAWLTGRDESEAMEIVVSLEERGLAFLTVLSPDELPWVWCSRWGAKLSRTDLGPYTPTLRSLELLRAVNQVHVALERGREYVRWFSARVLEREGYDWEGLPSALALIDGKTYAIEVVLGGRGSGELERKLIELSDRCENVLCYSSEGLHSRVRAVMGWKRNLAWREMPAAQGIGT